jgi:hypothetical protein
LQKHLYLLYLPVNIICPPMPNRPRYRDLGLTIGELPPGRFNAITDVAGVRVGHVTLIEGHGALVPSVGPMQTGVTAIGIASTSRSPLAL